MRITHRDDGGTRCTSEVLDDFPIRLFDGWGVRRFRCIRGVWLRRRCGEFGARCIEQQLNTGFTAVMATAHMLSEARPSSGGPGYPGYRSVLNFALEEWEKARLFDWQNTLSTLINHGISLKTIFVIALYHIFFYSKTYTKTNETF